jgi:hypothetical protein
MNGRDPAENAKCVSEKADWRRGSVRTPKRASGSMPGASRLFQTAFATTEHDRNVHGSLRGLGSLWRSRENNAPPACKHFDPVALTCFVGPIG